MRRVASLCLVVAVGGCSLDLDFSGGECIDSPTDFFGPGEQHPSVAGKLVLDVQRCSDLAPEVRCNALMAGARMQAWVLEPSDLDGTRSLVSGDLDVVRFVDVARVCGGTEGTLITGTPGEVLLALTRNSAPLDFFPVRVVRGATLTIVSPTGAPPVMTVGESRDYVLQAHAEDGELLHPGAIDWGSVDPLVIRVNGLVASAIVRAERAGSAQIFASTDSLQASLRIDVQ